MRRNIRISAPVVVAFLVVAVGISACGGADLPCPIPRDKMNDPDPDWVAFTLVNESCTSFCSMSIAPTKCDDWGYDWLGTDSLAPGEQWTIKLPPGRYDLFVEDCTQQVFIWEKINVLEESSFEVTGDENSSAACVHSLTVENNASEPICHMWIAGPHSESFGLNWLGEDSIPSGETRTFIVPEGSYDLKAEACDFRLLHVELDVQISGETFWDVPADQ
ncbi:MAG: hypothetical protein JXA25_04415 [Anaerolineales bacterium]|nr:hypothetical protein [Anaerolineales bacterium]